jgi:hypothetical protein
LIPLSSSSHSSSFIPIFFDSGSTCSWVNSNVADIKYVTEAPVQLSGIGGKTGPIVRKDAIIRLRFAITTGLWTPTITFSCGVCKDSTFPAPITIGRHLYEQLNIGYIGQNLCFYGLPGQPQISPIQPRKAAAAAAANTVFTVTPATNPQASRADEMLSNLKSLFPGVFDARLRKPTVKSRVHHYIRTKSDRPIKIPPRRYSPSQIQAMRDFCEKGLREGFLAKEESPYSSPALLVPKKPKAKAIAARDEAVIWRFCIDYRALNADTVKHAHPLPNVTDQIQKAAGHRFYAFLDLLNGFWQIEMAPEDRAKTAFSTPFGLFVWLVMPFGLANAPATFQSFIEEVLLPVAEFTAGILDDICVFADSLDELYTRVKLVLARLAAYGLALNTGKCEWFVLEGRFLGFFISRAGIRSDPAKIAAILERPPPTTATEVRSFLNAAGYFRHFIERFAHHASSLYDLTGLPKGSRVELTREQHEAWRQLRDALTKTPLLRPFDWTLPVVLETDASQLCCGAVLLQPHPVAGSNAKTTLHPVAYMSHKLSLTQQRYATQERELLAVILALQQWRHWLEGADITVVTDHDSLKQLRTKQDQPARMLRFLATIEHYGVRIIYRKGKANVIADYLSRPTDNATVTVNATDEGEGQIADQEQEREAAQPETKPAKPSAQKTRLTELNWLDLQAIFEFLHAKQPCPPNLAEQWVRAQFVIHRDQLHKVEDQRLLAIPTHAELLAAATQLHRDQGHCSAGLAIRELGKQFWHPEMTLTVYEAIRTCVQCELMRKPDPTPQDLTPIQPAEPLTRWAIDHTGPIANRLLLNTIEYVTGWAEGYWVRDSSGTATVEVLEAIRKRFGPIRELISDNAGAFRCAETNAWRTKHNITLKPTSPAHPRTNGRIERFNGIIKTILAKLALDNRNIPIYNLLPKALYIYNRRPGLHGYSPYFLLYGVNPLQEQQESQFGTYIREPTEAEEAAFARELAKQEHVNAERRYVTSLKATRDAVRAKLQEAKAYYRTYETGDWVLRVRQRKHKLEPYYDGPWAITAAHAGNTYTLASPGGIQLRNRYNGAMLFPAYVQDGHPERSLWYASKRLLQQDRDRQLAKAGIARRTGN